MLVKREVRYHGMRNIWIGTCFVVLLSFILCSCVSDKSNSEGLSDTTEQSETSRPDGGYQEIDNSDEPEDSVDNKFEVNQVGNLHSNLKTSNDGMMAEQDGWIYFGNPHDDYKLYKMQMDGSDLVKLNDDKACFSINVIGDWIYYTQGWIRGGFICKIRTNGTDKTVLYENPCHGLVVEGEWMYFFGVDEPDGKTICKMDTSGERFTRINEIGLPGEWELTDLYVREGYLYFSIFDKAIYDSEGHFSQTHALISISCDGNDDQYRFTSFMRSRNFIVTAEGLFYSNEYRQLFAFINLPYTIDNENTGWTNLDEITGDALADEVLQNVNTDELSYSNGWIFYIDDNDIVKIRADASGEIHISENVLPDGLVITRMYTLGDWVFIWTVDEECYKFRIDGSEFQSQAILP